MNNTIHDYLNGSLVQYLRQKGTLLHDRTQPYDIWERGRRTSSVMPYQRVSISGVGNDLILDDDITRPILNFSSQDYLGLAQDGRMVEAAARGARDFGVHSAGSPAFCGATKALRDLEGRIAGLIGAEEAVVYPTGWAAGYGVPVALIRSDDLVLMDALSHNCIQ
jgi:glycine C-acetyltransferase